MKINRRNFLKISLAAGGYLITSSLPILEAATGAKEALYYKTQDDLSVQCLRCPQGCIIQTGKRGFCRIRENQNGKLYNIVYGKPCAVHIDPIEKKPFFHVLPGTNSFSIATVGCNLRCKFCQNWQISQAEPEQIKSADMSPEYIVSKAEKSNCPSIAYTYTEPTVFYEYTLDTAKIARERGIKNVMHSNGFINPAPLRQLCKYFTAINVDLKGFSEDFYETVCSGRLKNVLESIMMIKNEMGVWLELTNLIIPTLNDNKEQITKMCHWIRDNLGDDVPVHFSRFFPMYKLTSLPPTPVSTLEQAYDIGRDAGLKYVYVGNLPGHEGENTYCPACGTAIVKRVGYTVIETSVKNSSCGKCGEKIAGVWTI